MFPLTRVEGGVLGRCARTPELDDQQERAAAVLLLDEPGTDDAQPDVHNLSLLCQPMVAGSGF
jgi:hypothetical protein